MLAKYREIGDFHDYYSGARTAPYPTIFIGGNHEASNYLWELYYGGWVAPNIYYMGAANVIRFGPLRIVGMSGIWKGYNYKKPHHERLPYSNDDIKSIYHIRELDVRKLLQIRTQTDIGISHDWPRAIEWHGDHRTLFRKKDMFESESKAGTLGSAAAKYVMERLRPAWWFAAHMHIKFSAVVTHEQNPAAAPHPIHPNGSTEGDVKRVQNDEEIDLDLDMEDGPPVATTDDAHTNPSGSGVPNSGGGVVPESIRSQLPASFQHISTPPDKQPDPMPRAIKNRNTRFLALDKCLPHRQFLQLLELGPISDVAGSAVASEINGYTLRYDKEWLAITRVFAHDLHLGDASAHTPRDMGNQHYGLLIEQEENWVEEHLVASGKMDIPINFEQTAPTYDPSAGDHDPQLPAEYNNPQTIAFCSLLEIPNKFYATDEEKAQRMKNGPPPESIRSSNFNNHRGGRRGRGGSRSTRRGGRW